jgi:hypothetical protein
MDGLSRSAAYRPRRVTPLQRTLTGPPAVLQPCEAHSLAGVSSTKPKGNRHKVTMAVQGLLDGEAEALTRKCVELAMDGDTTALRLCMERLAPAVKSRAVI